MKKHYVVLAIFGMCLLLVAGIWGGVVLADRLHQKHEESRAKINAAVAVVNQDMGVTVDGQTVNYAGAVIETLGSDYSLVSASAAQKGYENGIYGAVVTFPADFSENIVSINEKTPRQAVIQFDINPQLPEDRFVPLYLQLLGVQQQVNNTIAHAYVLTLYEQLHAAQDEVATLLANDEIDMEAVKKVVFNNYMDYLQLGDMPTVTFKPERTDVERQMAAAGSVAADVNKVYVDSYQQAQEDFDEVEKAISEYGNGLVNQSERWAQDMDQWADEAAKYLGEIKSYEQILLRWQDSANTFLEDEEAYLGEVRQYVQDANAHLQGQANEINAYHDKLSTWRSDAKDVLGEVAASADAISQTSEQLNGFSESLSGSLSDYTGKMDEFSGKLNDYSLGVNSYFAEMNKYSGDMKDYGQKMSAYTDAVDDYFTELNTYSQTVDTHIKDLGVYATELQKFFNEMDDFSEDFEQYIAGVEKYSSDVADYLGEINTLIGDVSETITAIYLYKEEVDTFIEDVNDYFTREQELIQDISVYAEKAIDYADGLEKFSNGLESWDIWLDYLDKYQKYVNDPAEEIPEWPETVLPVRLSELFAAWEELGEFEVQEFPIPDVPTLDAIELPDLLVPPPPELDQPDFPGLDIPKRPTDEIPLLADGVPAISQASAPKLPAFTNPPIITAPALPSLNIPALIIPDLLVQVNEETSRLKAAGENTLEGIPNDMFSAAEMMSLKEDTLKLPEKLGEKEELVLTDAPERPGEIDAALNDLIDIYAKYNPEDYLNEKTEEEAKRVLDRFSMVLHGAEGAVQASEMGNLAKLNEIYFEYNRYIGELRQKIHETYSTEHGNLKDSLDELNTTLEETSKVNHALLDSFVSRMPNSRQESTVNQKSVEGTIYPVTYSLDYIRNIQQYDQSEVAMRLLAIMSLLALTIILYIIYLISLYVRRKKRVER